MAAAASGTGLQIWTLAYLPNAPQANTYDFTVNARAACNSFLSGFDCSRNFLDFYFQVNTFPLQGLSLSLPCKRGPQPVLVIALNIILTIPSLFKVGMHQNLWQGASLLCLPIGSCSYLEPNSSL